MRRLGMGMLMFALGCGGSRPRGQFDQQAVVRAIQSRRQHIQICYQRFLRSDPNLVGRIEVAMTIEESGRVTNARSVSNSTGQPDLASCVVDVIRTFRFDPGPVGGTVSYTFPFVFEPQ